MIRKMQASYAWDWGPAFPSVGIWKNVSIEAFNSTIIRHVVTDLEVNGTNWLLHVDTYLVENHVKGRRITGELVVALKITDNQWVKSVIHVSVDGKNPAVSTSLVVPKSKISTWWPNGYGDQKLYTLEVTYKNGDEQSFKQVSVGFRTIELVEEPIGKGLSYYFKVNNVPIFMKGSNQIPIHILPELGQDKQRVRRLFQAAKDSHMNMLRVWGGGVYESEYFYEVADEMGILIWQDFMFACAMYPTNEEFLDNVLEEVDYQVKRLSGHTSIALFAGNNENEAALRDNWYGTSNFTLYKNDYVKLYVETVKRRFEEITHKRRIFITSSPSNGKQSELEGYVAQNPGNPQFGDVHFYDYTIDPVNSSAYPLPRFASEYGYESFPCLDSWKEVVQSDSDLDVNGKFFEHRQHHPGGNQEMLNMINREFLPINKAHNKYTEAIIYFSQVIQALGTKTETEHYRIHRSIIDEEGKGRTMGALYWQLNDVWVAPSWGSIDYTGRWKLLQYHVKEFLAPVIITGYIDTDKQLKVYVVSDLTPELPTFVASICVYRWNSFTPVSKSNIMMDIDGGSSKLIHTIKINVLMRMSDCGTGADAFRNCFIHLSMIDQSGKQMAPNNYVFPTKIRKSSLQNPKLKISSVKKGADKVFNIEVTSENIALFVTLDSHKIRGTFSDNGFVLVEKNKTVIFFSENDTTTEELLKELTVVSVFDYTDQS
ncbi:unnamed protein product [Acanthoscelides obtectus]|nr:unnamed protein product [Acanthoscelides obtectus]CAK1674379.1 Beta-mannosidase [Acanthoscelides obtectus]